MWITFVNSINANTILIPDHAVSIQEAVELAANGDEFQGVRAKDGADGIPIRLDPNSRFEYISFIPDWCLY